MLRLAKEEGISVSGEVCPHHFTLTSDDIVEGDTNYKMNPPLRTKEDRKALLEGLKNDVFDVISTDHAPHTMVEKGVSMKSAPFGIVGLETSVSLTITELVDKGWITPMQMAEKMSYNPAKSPASCQQRIPETGKRCGCGCDRPERILCDRCERFCIEG